MKTITVPDIDLQLLRQQRNLLLDYMPIIEKTSHLDADLASGIINMLDWMLDEGEGEEHV